MKLIVKPIPVPKGFIHPPPKNDILPSHEFTMGIIAPKGSGKVFSDLILDNCDCKPAGFLQGILPYHPGV